MPWRSNAARASALLDADGSGLRVVVRQGVGVDNLKAELPAERNLPGSLSAHCPT